MKLQFKKQKFQSDAVDSVVDLFKGQEKTQSTFSMIQESQMNLFSNAHGVGNKLFITQEQLIQNMQDIQAKNHLPLTDDLENRQFSIEMETGTGKTYVYTKTIFELNKQYGFTKFIIVVPSVAIREGVYKSFQVTNEHFSKAYQNIPYRYFIYDSAKLSEIRQFASSSEIEIMIINIDAFKKSENIINQKQDKLGGEAAIKYIQDTNPIVIIDEPQSVDNTLKSKEAISLLNPLTVFRYSATHREKINLMYRLTPVDAYQMGLVKQINVASCRVENNFNQPYIRLSSVKQDNNGFTCRLEIDALEKNGEINRKILTVKPHTDLFYLSGEREIYNGFIVSDIDCTKGRESVEFENSEKINLGETIGSIDEMLLKKAQIRKTIELHLAKELIYYKKGIKVLSLFFIDKVEKYRKEDGQQGVYAQMFEECYNELICEEKYAPLKKAFDTNVSKAHDGYFSQDKRGNYKNTKGDALDDINTYDTIMKDKEWLLSFDCPLRFIFSHSALKEGWDNPNVFQVCTLIEQKSTLTCRQKIGRGLRLCVNQQGVRVEDKDINILHVISNETFSEFADKLQKEIEVETGIQFGMLDIDTLIGSTYVENVEEEKHIEKNVAKKTIDILKNKGYLEEDGRVKETLKKAIKENKVELPKEIISAKEKVEDLLENEQVIDENKIEDITYTVEKKERRTINYDDAKELMEHLEKKDYISKKGKIKDTMKNAIKNGTLDLPARFEAARQKFETIVKNMDSKPPLRDASKDVIIKLKSEMVHSNNVYFHKMWNVLRFKTRYFLKFNTQIYIKECIKRLSELNIDKTQIVVSNADIDIKKAGVVSREKDVSKQDIQIKNGELPDLFRIIESECVICKNTIEAILNQCDGFTKFINNPQLFIEKCTRILNDVQHNTAITDIYYQKSMFEDKNGVLTEEFYNEDYKEQLFVDEIYSNIDNGLVEVNKSIYNYVICSNKEELKLVKELENNNNVSLFFKIPKKYKIKTPFGNYTPTWIIYCYSNSKIYILDSEKGNNDEMNQFRLKCGKEHFKVVDKEIRFLTINDWLKSKKVSTSEAT